ncbi:oligosaccharide flippase family protein [Niallia alba]|uniref:oligosaccharide flippase family protein n=1 Tax=Niallia alba TaxID=2729105 RepID=UPI0039A18017
MLKQLMSFSLGPVVGAIISVISIPVITRMVSPSDYGLLNLFITFFNFLFIMASFSDYAFAKKYYRFKEERQTSYLLWNNTMVALKITFVIGSILLFIPEHYSTLLFKVNTSKYICYLMVILLLFAVFDRFSQLSIRMQSKGLLYSVINIENKLLVLIFTVLLVIYFPELSIAPILAFVCAQVFTGFTSFYLSRSEWKLKNVKINTNLQKDLLKFSLPMFPSTLIMWGLSSLTIIFLNAFSNLYEIGLFSGAQRIANILAIIQTSFMSFWMPMAFKLDHEKASYEKFTKVNEAVLASMVGIFLLVLLLKDIIILFLGNEYQEAIYLIPFTLFFPIMYTLSEAIGVGFALKEKVRFNLISSAIALIAFLFFSILLIPKFGGIGAAISSAISYTTLFWAKALFSRKIWYEFSLNKYIKNTIFLILYSLLNTFIQTNFIYIINIFGILIFLWINWNQYYFRVLVTQIKHLKKHN